jgi:hypothetical protein
MSEQTTTGAGITLPDLSKGAVGSAKESETDKLRAEMMVMMKQFSEQNAQLAEQNASLQAQLKIQALAAQTRTAAPEAIPLLPDGIKVGDEVTYINHSARPEHGKIVEISEATGTVLLEIHGAHENDVSFVPDVKFGDKRARGTFTLAPPPEKPKVSLPKSHPKGLQTPGA